MKNNNPLVSMITYCYNGENFLASYFDAVLAQTYDNIELIFFNNGSTDNTKDIIAEYEPKLKSRDISVTIITLKENNPYTCELKQQAFKMMKGEYFFGCDSDDIIHPDYIEKMAGYLDANRDKGIVYCRLNTVDENGKLLGLMKMEPQIRDREAFENIIMAKNTNFTAISYMMSTKWFDKINPSREIYISKYGENYQVQMPFLYDNLNGYIHEDLGDYTVRKNSYSGQLDNKKKLVALKAQETTISETLRRINTDDYDRYNQMAKRRLRRDSFYVALKTDDDALIKRCYVDLKEVHAVTNKIRAEYILSKTKLGSGVMRFLKSHLRNTEQ